MPGHIYFMQAVDSRRIKIGYSTNPWRRLAAIQTSSPERIEIIAVIPGTPADEARLHRTHAEYHLHGEWFAEGAGLVADILRRTGADSPTPQQRESERKAKSSAAGDAASKSARIGAHISWANTTDRTARTAPARAAMEQKFLDEAGGDPVRAAHLRKAHFARLALASVKARNARKAAI